MRLLSRIVVATSVAVTIGAGVAYADGTIYAAPPNQFFQGDITINQGDNVTFTNADTVEHDVTAVAKGADGKPLFQSAKTGTGQSSPVGGVEYLTTGTYDYICSIHPFMKGTITVSASGTPKPRPGGGGNGSGSGSYQSSKPADTTPASLTVKVMDTKRSQVRKRRSLQLSVGTDEPATMTITATSGSRVVARGSAKFAQAGTRKVSVKLTKAGIAMTKKSKAVSITVTVNGKDRSGNASSAQASGKLR